MASDDPTSEAGRVCHEEQLQVWSDELIAALGMADFLKDPLDYDDNIELHAVASREIKRIVASAFDHPERTEPAELTRLRALAAVPEDLRAVAISRASDEALIEAGWDPQWIVEEGDQEGPYRVTREPTDCGCCGGKVLGWTVLDVTTATGWGKTWTHRDGDVDAAEHASALNVAWLQGRDAALAAAIRQGNANA